MQCARLYISLVSVDLSEPRDDVGENGGWDASASAWIDNVQNDITRKMLDPLVLSLCGDVSGARVLDVGSGEGRFSRMLSERGAACVGIDPTRRLLEAARDRGAMAPVRSVAEALPLRDAQFDLAITYITLVDIEHYREAIAEMARVLRPGGRIVAVNIGFASASVGPGGGWIRDGAGEPLYVAIDRYGEERSQVYDWSGIRIRNWHRPLSAYMSAYLRAGLNLRRFLEPVPPESLRTNPEVDRAARVPWFTVMVWEKPALDGVVSALT
jgi:SAM-dependent methyltransferase